MKKTKRKSRDKMLYFVIAFSLFFSYFELTNSLSIGGILRDFLFFQTRNIEPNVLMKSVDKEILSENIELKTILDINESLSGFEVRNATVVGRNNLYWLDELTINKGLMDGIYKDSIVVTNDGVVGKIKSVSFFTSNIQLITSFDSQLSVEVSNKNKILSTNDNKLIIKGINKEDDIKVGDIVTTSGLSDIFPKGLNIGVIDNIDKNSDGVGFIANVKLSANIDNLRFVAILRRPR